MNTFTVPGWNRDVVAWLHDHDVNPVDVLREVTVDDDGTVHLQRVIRDVRGRPVLTGCDLLTVTVIVTPNRPFPVVRP